MTKRWTVRGSSLQSILDNWVVFQKELWDEILQERVDSEVRGKAAGAQTKCKVLIPFLEYNWEF